MDKQASNVEDARGWAVHAWGSPDARPLVLLHGFLQEADSWTVVAEGLSRECYVLAPTITSEQAEDATLDTLADMTLGVVQLATMHTGYRRVALAGYSMGGRIALSYARKYAKTLSALVLESAGLGPETEDEREAERQRNERMVRRLRSDEPMGELVDTWESQPLFLTQRHLPPELRRGQRARRMSCDRNQMAWLAERAGAHTMPAASQARKMLSSLDVPVLYLAGRQDEKYCKKAQTLQDCGVRVQYLNGGHNLHLEQPVEYTQCVLDFLNEEDSRKGLR